MKRSLDFEEDNIDEIEGEDHIYEDNLDDIKAEKNKERNREHAKKTRLRKKAMIDGLKSRLLELQKESANLELLLEETNTASILMCLKVKRDDSPLPVSNLSKVENIAVNDLSGIFPTTACQKSKVHSGSIIDQLRFKVRAEAAQKFRVLKAQESVKILRENDNLLLSPQNTQHSEIPRSDDKFNSQCIHDDSTRNLQFDQENPFSSHFSELCDHVLEKDDTLSLDKKERNRIHAKMTRDRKKLFTCRMQQLIHSLERKNSLIRTRLNNSELFSYNSLTNSTNSSAIEKVECTTSNISEGNSSCSGNTDSDQIIDDNDLSQDADGVESRISSREEGLNQEKLNKHNAYERSLLHDASIIRFLAGPSDFTTTH